MMVRRVVMAAVISGVLIAGAGTAALANQGHSAAATPAITTHAISAATVAQTWGLGPRHGAKGRHAHAGILNGPRGRRIITFIERHLRGRRVLRVSAVNGDVINATTLNSRAVTITVSATTAYTEAGAAASLSDIHAGSIIAVRGTRSGAGTANAAAIVILLPRVAGVVTALNGDTLTVTGRDAAPHTITVSGTTRYVKAGQSAALTDVATGTAIVAEGTLNSDGSLSAVRLRIVLPHVAGKVTAVNGSSITVTNLWGATHTVVTSASTTYATLGNKAAEAASVTVGARIIAAGTLSADGQTLNAAHIRVIPQGSTMGLRARLKHLIMGRLGAPAAGNAAAAV